MRKRFYGLINFLDNFRGFAKFKVHNHTAAWIYCVCCTCVAEILMSMYSDLTFIFVLLLHTSGMHHSKQVQHVQMVSSVEETAAAVASAQAETGVEGQLVMLEEAADAAVDWQHHVAPEGERAVRSVSESMFGQRGAPVAMKTDSLPTSATSRQSNFDMSGIHGETTVQLVTVTGEDGSTTVQLAGAQGVSIPVSTTGDAVGTGEDVLYVEEVEILAELGIALLLFSIGIELSLRRFLRSVRQVVVGGGMQGGLVILGGVGMASLLGRELGEAVFLGFLLSLSSTAIVLKPLVGDTTAALIDACIIY